MIINNEIIEVKNTMKKFFVFTIMISLLISGCGKEFTGDINKGPVSEDSVLNPIVFSSTSSEQASRVTIDGYTLKFTAGDKIAVASYNFASETAPITSDYANYDGAVESTSGTFTPATNVYGATWAGAAAGVSFYSYYPASAAPSITGTNAAITNIATSQDGSLSNILCWAKGSKVATAADVTAGKAPSFSFSPVCALLKLTIINNDDTNDTSLSSISFTATSGNKIAGAAALNLLTGALSGGTSATLEYTPASNLELSKSGGSTTLYLALIPTTISSLNSYFTDTRAGYCYTAAFNKALPEALLPGRMYERTLTISDISFTGISGSLSTYNGIKFANGFLKRSNKESTSSGDMVFSDATTNPLEILNYANESTLANSYHMYFSWNELNTIFDGESNNSFDSKTITINTVDYKVPSSSNYTDLVSTTRSSNAPTINGSPKAWSCVKVMLSDSYFAIGTDYSGKGFESNNTAADYIRGMLFFPDGSTVTCGDIDASKCDSFTNDIVANPNTITTKQLDILIDGGCLFVPFVGGHSKTPAWVSRGSNGYLWSSTYTTGCVIVVITGSSPVGIAQNTYSGARRFPVILVKAD